MRTSFTLARAQLILSFAFALPAHELFLLCSVCAYHFALPVCLVDFGNPKQLRFLTICFLFWVLKRLEEEGGGGWQIVTDFVTRLIRPKYLLKKSDRRCTFTQNANKDNDDVTFSIPITFEQVSKQRLKVKNSIKRLLNAIF